MSTKIYYGFRVEGGLGAAYEAAFKFAPRVLEHATTYANNLIVRNYVAAVDRYALDPNAPPPPKDLGEARFQFCKDWKEGRDRDEGLYTDLEVTFLFYPGPYGSALGRMCYGVRPHYDEWLKEPGVAEYRYWNNTDAPEGMPSDEWERRKRNWARVTDHYQEKAMRFDCLGTAAPFGLLEMNRAKLHALVPPLEERASLRAADLVRDAYFRGREKPESVMDLLRELRVYEASPEYREAVTSKTAELMTRLPTLDPKAMR